jgi:hypothetical protein
MALATLSCETLVLQMFEMSVLIFFSNILAKLNQLDAEKHHSNTFARL